MKQKIKYLGFLLLFGCQSGDKIPTDLTITTAPTPLTAIEVDSVVTTTASALSDETMAIAVVDRIGNPLALYLKPQATQSDLNVALSLARTGAFFSNDQAPLSSRTVSYISREHFPPGIDNTASGALFGIEHTNRGCDLNVPFVAGKELPAATDITNASPGVGVTVTSGGVPLFRDGRLIGGLGVAGVSEAASEYAAVVGLSLFPPTPADPGVIFIDSVALPFVEQTTLPAGSVAGVANGVYFSGPIAGSIDPNGELMDVIDSPTADDPKLLATDVRAILDQAIARANRTRAAIRLPLGQRAKMVIAVSDLEGNILGLHRMVDSTVFSVDVAVAKARNVTYFSGNSVADEDRIAGIPLGTAMTNRTLGFAAQPFFPPGITGSDPGPYRELYEFDEANPCTQGRQPASANQNGIVFFPGSSPLYKNGVLVGGVGVSGDGVEQDDYVTAAAIVGYEPSAAIRADQFEYEGVRLPFFKFPRNPEN